MKYLVGDEVHNTMRDKDGIVTTESDGIMIYVDYGTGPQITNTAYLVLKHKGTDVQNALRNDPEALTQLVPFVTRISVSGNPLAAEKTAAALSENSALTEIDALDHYQATSERSHAAKFDVFAKKDIPQELSDRLGVLFHLDGQRAKQDEVQLNSRPLALWLMKNHGLLPEKVA